MGAFLGISLWVALATVVPGLITLAAVYGAIVVVNPCVLSNCLAGIECQNDWVWGGIAITTMVLTQAFGILLEKVLVDKEWLGPRQRRLQIPRGIDPHGQTSVLLEPYFEYKGLYLLLAELRDDEDSQGHLKRVLAQFFLTNNTLVSYGAGIVAAGVFVALQPQRDVFVRGAAYILVLACCLLVSYRVARVRFEVMTKSLWAARRRRLFDDAAGSPAERDAGTDEGGTTRTQSGRAVGLRPSRAAGEWRRRRPRRGR